MRTRKSNYVTKSGLIVLAASIIIAAYFKHTDITAFIGLILLLSLCAFLWARWSLKNIKVYLHESELYAFPGDEFDLDLEFINDKGLLLMWLDLVFPLADAICIGQEMVEHFSWIMPHQSISCHSAIPAVRRGVTVIDNICLRSGDGFCLSEEEKSCSPGHPLKFTVYPKISPIDPSPLMNLSSEPEPAKNGLYTDRTLINNVRLYNERDNFKDINWRMMARSDEAVVNVHETMAMHRIGFIIDLGSFSFVEKEDHMNGEVIIRKVHDDALEEAISKIASYIVALNERDIICTLVIPSTKLREARMVIPQTKETQIVELLSALAEIEYYGEESFLPEAEMDSDGHLLGQIYRMDYKHGLMKLAGGEYEEIQ